MDYFMQKDEEPFADFSAGIDAALPSPFNPLWVRKKRFSGVWHE